MALIFLGIVRVKGRSMHTDVIRTLVVDVLNTQRAWADATAQEQLVVDA